MAAARSRLPIYLAAGAAGVGGYYMYRAGGRPSLAEKEAEHDAARLSAKAKSHLPGTGKEAKTEGKVLVAEAGAKLDDALNEARSARDRVDAKGEQLRRDAERKINQVGSELSKEAHDASRKFDKAVEQGTEKAKSGWSSIFGGGGK